MHESSVAVPWGIFGSGNIGDEAMLQGFAELVKELPGPHMRYWVACRNKNHVSEVVPDFRYFGSGKGVNPLRWWILRSSRAYLIVGDTPIMDYLGSWPLAD